MANYVKFMRGTKAAYDALVTKNADTLYFITDSENKTSLYLGETLVSNSTNNLSPAAQAFLESFSTDENQLSDGDIQVYIIKQEEKEVTDSETGETTTIIETKGEWVTKNIDEVLPLNELAENLSPLILQRILGDDENNINDSYDTIKEISDWILNHPSDAVEINERLLALEEAVGTGQTETEIRPVVDENDNPVYEQLIDEETGKPQYLDIDSETTDIVPLSELEEGQPVYPAYEENPEGDEPPYIPITDPETGEQLYWDLNEEPILIDDESGDITNKPPAFIQETEEVEVSVPNDVEIIKAVIGNLDTVYPQVKTAQIGTLTDRLDILENNFQTIQSVIIGEDNQGIQIIPIGTLESLNEDLHTYDTNDNDTSSLVKAINILDERMQWHALS